MGLNKKGLYESEDKMVSHPGHYQSSTGLEVIDVIEAFTEGLEGIEATDTGNIIKYACRWKDKNGIQDLEKILWYTQHLISHIREKDKVVGDSATSNHFTTKLQGSIYGCKGEDTKPINLKSTNKLTNDCLGSDYCEPVMEKPTSKGCKPSDVYNPPIIGCVGKTDVVDIFIAYGDMINFVKSLGPKHGILDEIKWIRRNPDGNIIRLPIEIAMELGYIDTTLNKESD